MEGERRTADPSASLGMTKGRAVASPACVAMETEELRFIIRNSRRTRLFKLGTAAPINRTIINAAPR